MVPRTDNRDLRKKVELLVANAIYWVSAPPGVRDRRQIGGGPIG